MRIDGPTIYLRFLDPSEIDGLKSAVQPHNPYPRILETQKFKKSVESRNFNMFRDRQLTDLDEKKIFLAICQKDTDNLLGYTEINFMGTLSVLRFTAILPEHRSGGIYSETIYLRHRLCFDVLNSSKCQINSPLNDSGDPSSVVSPIYSGSLHEFKRGQVMWRTLEVTKQEYQDFLDNNPNTNAIPWSFSWD
jgi:hypothetical protein